jgi:hypothetical protein
VDGRFGIAAATGKMIGICLQALAVVVAESYASGAVVSEVARRHEVSPQRT